MLTQLTCSNLASVLFATTFQGSMVAIGYCVLTFMVSLDVPMPESASAYGALASMREGAF